MRRSQPVIVVFSPSFFSLFPSNNIMIIVPYSQKQNLRLSMEIVSIHRIKVIKLHKEINKSCMNIGILNFVVCIALGFIVFFFVFTTQYHKFTCCHIYTNGGLHVCVKKILVSGTDSSIMWKEQNSKVGQGRINTKLFLFLLLLFRFPFNLDLMGPQFLWSTGMSGGNLRRQPLDLLRTLLAAVQKSQCACFAVGMLLKS